VSVGIPEGSCLLLFLSVDCVSDTWSDISLIKSGFRTSLDRSRSLSVADMLLFSLATLPLFSFPCVDRLKVGHTPAGVTATVYVTVVNTTAYD